MDITLTINNAVRLAALARATAAYNEKNAVITQQDLLQMMIDQQLDSVAKVYVQTSMSRLAFLQRFTVDERVAIRAAAASNGVIHDYLELLAMSEQVDLTHTTVSDGVRALEQAQLIAPGRADQILAI